MLRFTSSNSTLLRLIQIPRLSHLCPSRIPTIASSPSGSLQRNHLQAYALRTHGSSIPLHTEMAAVEFTNPLECLTLLSSVIPLKCIHVFCQCLGPLPESLRRPSLVALPNIFLPAALVRSGFLPVWSPWCLLTEHLRATSSSLKCQVHHCHSGPSMKPLLKPNESLSTPTITPTSGRCLKTHTKADTSYLEEG